MASATATSTGITLKGSVKIVTEFFEYSINNILYQREVYPPESFRRVAKYGLAMFVTTDDGLAGYLANVMTQLQGESCAAGGYLRDAACPSLNDSTQASCMQWQNG